MLPDGLEQTLGRQTVFIAQDRRGDKTAAPDGVEIFRAGIHAAVFCAAGGKVKLANQFNFEKVRASRCVGRVNRPFDGVIRAVGGVNRSRKRVN